jgi:hypothetical protein
MARISRWTVARGLIALPTLALLAGNSVQCSAASETGAGNGGTGAGATSGSGGIIGIDVQSQDASVPEFVPPDDPPPTSCDGGGNWAWPGGTEECPADKNYQGCPCTREGETAACWPGYRKHKNRGACRDGTTTCRRSGEIVLEWGPCEGYTGIDPVSKLPLGATGKAACTCFSGGYWQIANTSPCFSFTDPSYTQVQGAVSTLKSTGNCPPAQSLDWQNPAPPAEPWSANTVTADCSGYFKLCFTLKALPSAASQPAPSDCVMKQICTEENYTTIDQPQAFPDLPGWITAAAAEKSCAQAFITHGGYAEMSVVGESDECDKLDKVFQRVTYCPIRCSVQPNSPAGCGNKSCEGGENASNCASDCDPDCIQCQSGGGGPF